MTQLDRTTPAVGNIPSPRRAPESLAPWTPTPPSGIRWLDSEPSAPPERPAPSRSRRRVRRLVGVGAVALLAVVGIVAALLVAANRTMTVQGSVMVAVAGTTLPGAPCSAPPVSGWTVSIFGSDGTLVASAPVAETGYAVDQWGTSSPYADGCRFNLLFTGVPAGDSVYRVGVGRSVADTTRFSRQQLQTTGASIVYGR